jgi:hypothetical protein
MVIGSELPLFVFLEVLLRTTKEKEKRKQTDSGGKVKHTDLERQSRNKTKKQKTRTKQYYTRLITQIRRKNEGKKKQIQVENDSKDIMFFKVDSRKGTHGGRKSRGKWR